MDLFENECLVAIQIQYISWSTTSAINLASVHLEQQLFSAHALSVCECRGDMTMPAVEKMCS